MKLRRTYLFMLVLVPLLLSGCGAKDPMFELPPPEYIPEEQDPIDDTPGEVDDPSGDPSGDQPGEKPWEANRGKIVTPSGTGWAEPKVIDEGVTYYTFSGKDDISGKNQEVFAVDLDLANPNYRVKLIYTSPRKVTSDVLAETPGAIAAMNANYEPTSIYFRVDGVNIWEIQNSIINGTTIPNWKNDGVFSCNGERGVMLRNAGCMHHGEVTLAQQRTWIRSISATDMPDLLSTGPVLVDDFNPLGENFCDYTIAAADVNKLNSEDPERHQRARHPRTAVGLTENNHFILFVVDGRNSKSSGMSCRELTRFMVKHFNPQYALNMDGGGSTVLCVAGEGDELTHVVNYPCDNQKYDHDGQRSRDVHFAIIKK